MLKFEEVDLKYQKHPNAITIIPTVGTEDSAGHDFYLKESLFILPNTAIKTSFDVKAKMQKDEVLKLYLRSSIAYDNDLFLVNGTGIIDADYYNNEKTGGNINIKIYNYGDEPIILYAGERIAQGICSKYIRAVNSTVGGKRVGGNGSTGKE